MKIHRLVFSPISVNTYILGNDSGHCAVIDCGCYDAAEFSRLTGFFEENGYNPVMLLNTHCHLDHIFGNGMMLERFGLKTMACVSEEDNLRSAPMHALMFGLEMSDPPGIGEYISDRQVVEFGDVTLEAIYVPGHTAGSIAWYSREENCVFTGDALFAGGIGRSDLPGGNFDMLVNNIKTRLLTLPPETIIFPGHGESSTIGREITNNPWLS